MKPLKRTIIFMALAMTAMATTAQTADNGRVRTLEEEATTTAQAMICRTGEYTLSPAEEEYNARTADIDRASMKCLYANPVFYEIQNKKDSTRRGMRSIVYSGFGGAESDGDFLPYCGNGSNDFRIGGFGEYATAKSGTLTGSIMYARGKHRNIGWAATRSPELYRPYFSTDSCGGDFYFESYNIKGGYALTLGKWTLGAKAAYYGEQAHRPSDPRALINNTWLRFNAGAGYMLGGNMIMADAGYGRNKQHMQLRYWRPGQQDRFFVCYGFGLYDIRQSAIGFGKARMFYIDEINARVQFLSASEKPLQIRASMAWNYQFMLTEESDIYNLYEAKTHTLNPEIQLTWMPGYSKVWKMDLMLQNMTMMRKGYENIIEDYLVDKANDVYDFRTIDTQQNYNYDEMTTMAAMRATRAFGNVAVSVQAGSAFFMRNEKYQGNVYSIKNTLVTPHIKAGASWKGKRDFAAVSIMYGCQKSADNKYDVAMSNQSVTHIDFQQAFAPYAYYASEYGFVNAEISYEHGFRKCSAGITAKMSLISGERLDDACYTYTVGYASTAPMITTDPDDHSQRFGSVTAFIRF